jgi:hypothetical protein
MPEIAKSELTDLIKHPDQHGASGMVVALNDGNQLPECKQVGPTCGIYSLDGALKLRGGWYAPPARNLGTRDKLSRLLNPSAIRIAKLYKRSQVGEIGSCEDIQFLAATMGCASTEIKRIDSAGELWAVITESAKRRRGIVMPYVCSGDEAEQGEASADGIAGYAHWCLVFGGYRSGSGDKRVLAVTYGSYFDWDVGLLQRSNAAIRDWESQTWIRYPMWWSNPDKEAASWERSSGARNGEWVKAADAGDTLDRWAEEMARVGWGFGLGFSSDPRNSAPGRIIVHARTWAPPGRVSLKQGEFNTKYTTPSKTLPSINQLRGVRQETLRAVAYSKTMAHRCVVV